MDKTEAICIFISFPVSFKGQQRAAWINNWAQESINDVEANGDKKVVSWSAT